MPFSALRKAKTIRSSPSMLDKAKSFFSGNSYEGMSKGKSGLADVGPSEEVKNEMMSNNTDQMEKKTMFGPYLHRMEKKTMFKKNKR